MGIQKLQKKLSSGIAPKLRTDFWIGNNFW